MVILHIRLYIGVNELDVWGNPPIELVTLLYHKVFWITYFINFSENTEITKNRIDDDFE